jgi:hypothetical protein
VELKDRIELIMRDHDCGQQTVSDALNYKLV